MPYAPDLSAATIQATPENVRAAIMSFRKGSAGGLDGLTPQHFKDLICGHGNRRQWSLGGYGTARQSVAVSEAEPKGSDCYEKFSVMQECMAGYPELYGRDDDDDLADAMDASDAAADARSDAADARGDAGDAAKEKPALQHAAATATAH